MNKFKAVVTGLVMSAVMAGTVGLASADDVNPAIKARQSLMQLYGFNLGIVGAMAKGKVDYDAKAAQEAADNLAQLVRMNGAMWPQGTSQSDEGLEKETRALAEIWTTYPKVAENGKQMVAAADGLAAVAGKGLDSLRGGLKDVGASCKACHKAFRGKKIK